MSQMLQVLLAWMSGALYKLTIVTEDDAMEDQVGQLTAFSSADGGYCGISFELISSQSHHYVSVTTDELHRKRNLSDLGDRHNNGPHQDLIFDNPLLSVWLWVSKNWIWLW